MTAKDNSTQQKVVVMEVQRGGERACDIFDEAEPCSLKRLAEIYNIERHELERKLQPFRTIIGERAEGYYSKEQVQKIYLLLGAPVKQNPYGKHLSVFPHSTETWSAACVRTFQLIQKVTKRILPSYYCERSIELDRISSSLGEFEEWEAEDKVIALIEKELIIYRHFAYYQPDIADSSGDVLERALTYYELLLHIRIRETLEIDAQLKSIAKLLLCYVQTGSLKLYCEIEKLLFTHNEKQLQSLIHHIAIEVYRSRYC